MGLIDELLKLSERVQAYKGAISTEEGTKAALIQPFIEDVLGYDVSDPNVVYPEFTVAHGKRVDYAILKGGKPIMLIECKEIGDQNLDDNRSQLEGYFSSMVAPFAILTNGDQYEFYSNLDDETFCARMDETTLLKSLE